MEISRELRPRTDKPRKNNRPDVKSTSLNAAKCMRYIYICLHHLFLNKHPNCANNMYTPIRMLNG